MPLPLPPWARLAPLTLALGGCAAWLGPAEAPQPPWRLQLEAPVQSASAPGLRLDARVVGPGPRLVAARHPWGTVRRVVRPYGPRSLVLRIQASAAAPTHLQPELAQLRADEGPWGGAWPLAHFRQLWPTWALQGEEEAQDQRVAYEAILDRLLVERRLAAGEALEGELVFPLPRPREGLSLRWPVEVGGLRQVLHWQWRLR